MYGCYCTQPQALLAAQEAARSAQRQQQADLLKKKEQLSKGFQLNSGAAAEAVAAAAKVLSQGAGTAAPGIATAPADELEVARVLHSRSDYECLKVGGVDARWCCRGWPAGAGCMYRS